jgi:uncharacterized membrane protein SpoIIM required for sporulation
MSWQFTFLPVILTVFWLLFVLKNLSSFRKEFQKMDRKDRSTELGNLFIKDVQNKYVWYSLIAFILLIGLYVAIYLLFKN